MSVKTWGRHEITTDGIEVLKECNLNLQQQKGIKRKRSAGYLEGTLGKVAKCLKKKGKMGSGCTKHTTRNVIAPVEEASTISAESTGPKVKKVRPPVKKTSAEVRPVLTDTFNLGSHEHGQAKDKYADHKTETKAFETFTKQSQTENAAVSRSLHSSVASLAVEDSSMTKRTQSCDEKLKHYNGQANLLDCKPVRKRSMTDDVFEKESMNSKKELPKEDARAKGLPPMQRRYRRQPTVENTLLFQEDDQINHYQIQEEIGRGSYATVYRCRSQKDQVEYAMKVISKKRLIRKNGLMARHPKKSRANPLDALHREIAILKKVDHPNVVKLVEVIDDTEIDNVYMIFELMERGPAQEIPTKHPMNEAKARQYFKDMVLGLEYLHHTKIIHRDIKPTNLLLDNDDHIKIADFGVSDIFEGEDDMLNRFAGSPAFQSPEAIAGGRVKFSGKAADIWAMGVTLFSFVFGKCPFFDTDLLNLYEKIRNDPLVFPEEPIIDPQLQDLISRLLAKDPKQRIKMQEIKEHPWLTKGGRELLPKTNDHCVTIEITDEDVKNSVTLISKLSSLVLVKTMLKRRTFSSSKKMRRSSARSNSTPDVSQSDPNFHELQTRVSKSATSLMAGKLKTSSVSR